MSHPLKSFFRETLDCTVYFSYSFTTYRLALDTGSKIRVSKGRNLKDCTVNFSYSFKHTVSTKDVWYKGITKIYHMKKGTPITICWFFGWGAKI